MSDNFRLREANDSDFDELFSIYMDPTVNPFLNFEIMNKHEFLPIFKEIMESGQLLVFESDNNIVATCVVIRQKRRASHVASLETLATHPDYQERGIGIQFMQELLKKLSAEGIKKVDLYVDGDNSLAQKFYKKLGFKIEGVLKQYYKRSYEDHYVDAHIMGLILKE